MMLTPFALMCTVSNRIILSYAVHQVSSFIDVIMIFITTWNVGYLFADKWVYSPGLWLGDSAYASYLCHIPVMYMVREIAFRVLDHDVSLGPQYFWYLVVPPLVLLVFFERHELPPRRAPLAQKKRPYCQRNE